MSLTDDIINYMRFLRDEYGLYISMHGNLRGLIQGDSEFLNHVNPYCIKVKSNPELYKKCRECQKKVIKRCQREFEFCGVCCYGVGEYVRGIECRGITDAFISVSGYMGRRNRVVCEADELYDKYIKGRPDTEKLHVIITPLAVMLEKAFSEVSGDIGNDIYSKILNYINQNPYDISLDKLCKRFNYSKSYISHIFKKNNGNTIKHYCNILKINEAAELLKRTDMSVTEAAYTAGFNDLSYFISLFRKIKGVTPNKFKMR